MDMKVDLHCHTKKVKSGDAHTRNVTKELFKEKVDQANVKIIAITNHNQFDHDQLLKMSFKAQNLPSLIVRK